MDVVLLIIHIVTEWSRLFSINTAGHMHSPFFLKHGRAVLCCFCFGISHACTSTDPRVTLSGFSATGMKTASHHNNAEVLKYADALCCKSCNLIQWPLTFLAAIATFRLPLYFVGTVFLRKEFLVIHCLPVCIPSVSHNSICSKLCEYSWVTWLQPPVMLAQWLWHSTAVHQVLGLIHGH